MILLVLAPAPMRAQMIFELVHQNIEPLVGPHAAFGDFDNDGDMDILVGGQTPGEFPLAISRVYIGHLDELQPPPGGGLPRWERDFTLYGRGIIPGWLGAVHWIDANHDARIDAVVVGANKVEEPYEPVAGVYFDSGPEWIRIPGELGGLVAGSLDAGDFNNDGSDDLLLTGSAAGGEYVTRLYTGDRRGQFVESGVPLPPVGLGDGRFADYDVDGDLDILLVGDVGEGFAAMLLRNDGGVFTEVETDILPVVFANSDWGDYDGDGDLDVAISGARLSGLLLEPVTKVYRNDGPGVFTDIGGDFAGSYYGAVRWGDFDNDGDLDLVETGSGLVDKPRAGRIYSNNGGDRFGFGANLTGMGVASVDVGDYDGDGDLDVIQIGESKSALFRNEFYPTIPGVDPPDEPFGRPKPPQELTTEIDGENVHLSWTPGSDDKTPASGLSYNIRVGSDPGSINVTSPIANPNTGRRRVSRMGNVQSNLTWTLKNLPRGTYFWSVQSIDTSFIGSDFADDQRFTIK
ncbi:MAG: FG-GAP repeat domain-containing protein [Rhodothermia bacterium]